MIKLDCSAVAKHGEENLEHKISVFLTYRITLDKRFIRFPNFYVVPKVCLVTASM